MGERTWQDQKKEPKQDGLRHSSFDSEMVLRPSLVLPGSCQGRPGSGGQGVGHELCLAKQAKAYPLSPPVRQAAAVLVPARVKEVLVKKAACCESCREFASCPFLTGRSQRQAFGRPA